MNNAGWVGIYVIYGNSSVTDTDRDRAKQAAIEVLEKAGVTADEAFSAYAEQFAELDCEDEMHGAALHWIAARKAADVALTLGWRRPNGASCEIYV